MWVPKSIAVLRQALAAQTLGESHTVDFKRQLASGQPGNKSLAVDLASFAVDGGVLYIGVDEDTDPPSVHPVSLTGEAERIDQVARGGRIDPPLFVEVRPLEDTPGHGVLVVIVPASADAPHQVDERYRSRHGVTNATLTAAEVRRIIESRSQARDRADDALERLVAEDPTDDDLPRLFVSAVPAIHRSGRLLDALPDGIKAWVVATLLNNAGPLVQRIVPGWPTDFHDGISVEPRADGCGIAVGRASRAEPWSARLPGEKGALDLELSEDGEVRLFLSRPGDRIRDDRLLIWEETVHGVVMRAVLTAAAVSHAAAYLGDWHVAVALVAIKGAVSGSRSQDLIWRPPVYTRSEYRRSATVSALALAADPTSVVRALVGQLNRALNLDTVAMPTVA